MLSYDRCVENLADVLVGYSTSVKKGDNVFIFSTPLCAPLIKQVYKKILLKGANPVVRLSLPGLQNIFYDCATDKQISYVPKFELYEARHMDVRIFIAGDTNLRSMANVDSKKLALSAKARRKVRNLLEGKRWSVTIFPTDAHAQEAGMSTDEFADFVFKATFADTANPVKKWQDFHKSHIARANFLNKARDVRIINNGTDLKMSVKGRKFIISSGTHNMPSGELFTGPVENTVNGHMKFSFPALHNGKRIEGLELDFKDGKVVKATAAKNQDYFIKTIDMDEGSRFVGELGIGTNYGIQKFTSHTLFDEKIGGTVHIALGASYPETGGKNKSALHWDLITDMRTGGEILVDGKVFQKNGKFMR
ncbi:MAG: aminopeptidase [Planctomycetes bacterium]|nr:aminopeptidase [Planctomycetota bacterium]